MPLSDLFTDVPRFMLEALDKNSSLEKGFPSMRATAVIIFWICTTLFSSNVRARSGWTDYVQGKALNPTGRNYYLVRLDVSENPSDCKDKSWFFQDYDTLGSDKMFLTLLGAVTSGGRVRVLLLQYANSLFV